MVRRNGAIAWGLSVAALACRCRADVPPEVVLRAKQATALVEVDERNGTSEGSAFCIDGTGLFVTNAHVVAPRSVGGKLSLVLRSGEKDQQVVVARVLALDKEADLAIVRTETPLNMAALTLGSADNLLETMPVVVFGYPFGSELALKDGDYPNISVNTGHITALRKSRGDLKSIQLDASLNPGNSGGPVLNEKGEVIAIVQEGIPGSGINSAIPISALRPLVSGARVLFTPPAFPKERLREAQEFRIELVLPPPDTSDVKVDLTLSAAGDDQRSYHAVSKDGRLFTVQAPLLAARSNSGHLQLTIRSHDSEIVGTTTDQTIRVGSVIAPLSRIREIRNGGTPEVILTDERVLHGPITGLSSIHVDLNGAPSALNLNQFEDIVVGPPPLPADVAYHLTVTVGGQVFSEQTGKIPLTSPVAPPAPRGVSNAAGSGRQDQRPASDSNGYVYFPGTGHWYGAIVIPNGLTWQQAEAAARALSYRGHNGHLVTVTSAAENAFVVQTFPQVIEGKYWMGGYKDPQAPDYKNPAAGWHWVTGEPWQYTNWNPGEPNGNTGGPHSDCLQFTFGGHWNDERNQPDNHLDLGKGYIVEFEP